MKIDFKLLILTNNSALEIVYVLHWWLNEQCPVTSLPLGDSTSSGPRGKSPKSAHLLTYSQPALRPQHNRPRHRFSSHADRARPNVPVLRPKAAPPSVAPHPSSSRPFVQGPLPRWCPSAEREPRAGDSNDSSGGAAGTHLRGVSYQQAPGPTHPRPLIGLDTAFFLSD